MIAEPLTAEETRRWIAVCQTQGLRIEKREDAAPDPHSRKNVAYGKVRDLAAAVAAGTETGTITEIAERHGVNFDSLRCQVWRARGGKGRAA